MTERLHFHFSPSCIGEGHGNPLQCSCLENPRDGGAWWAAVYGVAQTRTRLKRLSSSSSSMISDNHITLFSACHWWLTVHLLFNSCTDSKVHSDVVSLSSSDKLTWLFTKLDPWNRELANKDESAANKQKDSGSKIGKWLWTIGWRYPRGSDDSEKKSSKQKSSH